MSEEVLEIVPSTKVCEFIAAKKPTEKCVFCVKEMLFKISMIRIDGNLEMLELDNNLFVTNNEYIIVKISIGDVEAQIDLILDKSINAYQSGILTVNGNYTSHDATKISVILDMTLEDIAQLLIK